MNAEDGIMVIIQDAGGRAHHSEIVEKSRALFPDIQDGHKLRQVVGIKLRKLQRWCQIYKDYSGYWYIRK